MELVAIIEHARIGEIPKALVTELKAIANYDDFSDRCDLFGVFTNADTLEVDLVKDTEFRGAIFETLREGRFGEGRIAMIKVWEDDFSKFDGEKYLSMIDSIGKGRFAQRLVTRITGIAPPPYLENALRYVADRV